MNATLVCLATCVSPPTSNAQPEAVEEVVVRGLRYNGAIALNGKISQNRSEVPASLSVVTDQRIADQKFTTVAEALTYVTGVTVLPGEGLRSEVQSRGYALSVLNDGVPTYLSLPQSLQLDLAVYERLEVLRGPSAFLDGAGALGGSVNLVTKRGGDRVRALAAVTAGGWNSVRTMLDVQGPIAGRSGLRGRLVGMYEQREHFARGVDYDRTVGYASLDWELAPNTALGFSFATQSDGGNGIYTGLPSYESGALLDVPRSTSVTQDWARNEWDTSDRNVQLTRDFGGAWRVIARWRDRDQRTHFLEGLPWSGVRESDLTVPFGRRGTHFSTSQQGIDLYATGSFGLFARQHSLLVGYADDLRHSQFVQVERIGQVDQIRVRFDESALVPVLNEPYEQGGEVQYEQSGFYARAGFSVSEHARFIVGGRVSDFESQSKAIAPSVPMDWRNAAHENDYAAPMAAMVFDITARWSLYGSYAETFSPQTQLSVGGVLLEPRIGKQYEVGTKAEWFAGAFQTSIAIFDLRDTGRALPDAVNPGSFINAGKVQSRGWEAELVGSPAPRYEIQVGYSHLDSQFVVASADEQGDRFSPLEPQHSWKAWAIRRFAQAGGGGLTVGGGLVSQSGIEFEERSQGWYTVFSAMVGYRFNDTVSLDVNVNNLFDERYYARLGPINAYTVFGAPRNVLVTARVSL